MCSRVVSIVASFSGNWAVLIKRHLSSGVLTSAVRSGTGVLYSSVVSMCAVCVVMRVHIMQIMYIGTATVFVHIHTLHGRRGDGATVHAAETVLVQVQVLLEGGVDPAQDLCV